MRERKRERERESERERARVRGVEEWLGRKEDVCVCFFLPGRKNLVGCFNYSLECSLSVWNNFLDLLWSGVCKCVHFTMFVFIIFLQIQSLH